jgi:hypothetical protein
MLPRRGVSQSIAPCILRAHHCHCWQCPSHYSNCLTEPLCWFQSLRTCLGCDARARATRYFSYSRRPEGCPVVTKDGSLDSRVISPRPSLVVVVLPNCYCCRAGGSSEVERLPSTKGHQRRAHCQTQTSVSTGFRRRARQEKLYLSKK